MNSQLYNNIAVIPDTLIKHLTDSFSSVNANSNTEGYNRNQELRQSKKVTYQQIKRIKNWFDKYSGDKKDAPFILNGGDRMKEWCDYVLKSWRSEVEGGKKTKADTGMQNQYLKPHEKNSFNLNDKHKSTADELSVNEEVNRINKLINKII